MSPVFVFKAKSKLRYQSIGLDTVALLLAPRVRSHQH